MGRDGQATLHRCPEQQHLRVRPGTGEEGRIPADRPKAKSSEERHRTSVALDHRDVHPSDAALPCTIQEASHEQRPVAERSVARIQPQVQMAGEQRLRLPLLAASAQPGGETSPHETRNGAGEQRTSQEHPGECSGDDAEEQHASPASTGQTAEYVAHHAVDGAVDNPARRRFMIQVVARDEIGTRLLMTFEAAREDAGVRARDHQATDGLSILTLVGADADAAAVGAGTFGCVVRLHGVSMIVDGGVDMSSDTGRSSSCPSVQLAAWHSCRRGVSWRWKPSHARGVFARRDDGARSGGEE